MPRDSVAAEGPRWADAPTFPPGGAPLLHAAAFRKGFAAESEELLPQPTTVLCLASYEKGEEFIREAADRGARVVLLTVHELRDAAWPRECLQELLSLPDLRDRAAVLRFVSGLAWRLPVDVVVALDEFDVGIAAALREHLRTPGMGETTARYFRDKLAMRLRAREAGLAIPEFTPLVTAGGVREFAARVPPPWILKPRSSASTMGLRRLEDERQLWHAMESLGEERSFHLVERFVPGTIHHVDSVVWEREVAFAEVHRYARPPLEVYHGGGLFCSRTTERGSDEEAALLEANRAVASAMGMVRGVLHTEFIEGEDGGFRFLETAARVGGAYIADMVEAATGVGLWREWARLELAAAADGGYRPPERRRDYGAVLVTLARQEWPDTAAYEAPEVVRRLRKRHHAGLVLASPDPRRLDALLEDYVPRFLSDFHARLPPAETVEG